MKDYLVSTTPEPVLLYCYIWLAAYVHRFRKVAFRAYFAFCYFQYEDDDGIINVILLGPLFLTRCSAPRLDVLIYDDRVSEKWKLLKSFNENKIFKKGQSVPEKIVDEEVLKDMTESLIRFIACHKW
jgi:hypothetical protein